VIGGQVKMFVDGLGMAGGNGDGEVWLEDRCGDSWNVLD
jgi:hypothetical protein